MRIILKIAVLLLLVEIILFLPVFNNLNLLLNRNNDLTEFFWPIFYYLKQNILIKNQIPYWNHLFFASTPLLPDPQNPIWYLPNLILLLTNLDFGIFISIFIHTFFGGIGMFLLCRQNFNFSTKTSFFTSLLFISSATFLAFLVFSVASFIFNIESSKLIFLGILLLLPAFLFYFFEEFNTAEMIGNFIYGIFLLGTLKGILSRK